MNLTNRSLTDLYIDAFIREQKAAVASSEDYTMGNKPGIDAVSCVKQASVKLQKKAEKINGIQILAKSHFPYISTGG